MFEIKSTLTPALSRRERERELISGDLEFACGQSPLPPGEG